MNFKFKEYAPIILRIGVSMVFIWFGFTNVFNPNSLLGYLPEFIFSLKINPTTILLANGIFELIFGFFLLIGLFTRFSAFLLSLHLFLIAVGLGYNDLAVRDIGLTIATFVVFLNGMDRLCLDSKLNFFR